ncbi:MAG: hypothetical protein KAW45_05445 [Thermoplasmatales archaeon]|nr:hypothetical protein [Thermoplasmatales archaeon]
MQNRKLIVSIILIIGLTLLLIFFEMSGYFEENKKQDDTSKFFGTWRAIEISELFGGNNITNMTMTFYEDNSAKITTNYNNETVSVDYYYEFDENYKLCMAPKSAPFFEYSSICYKYSFSDDNTRLTLMFNGTVSIVMIKEREAETRKQVDSTNFIGTWRAIEISELFGGNNIINMTMTFYNDNTATITTTSKDETVSVDYYYEFDGYDTLSLTLQDVPEYSICYSCNFSNYNTTITLAFGGTKVFILEKVIEQKEDETKKQVDYTKFIGKWGNWTFYENNSLEIIQEYSTFIDYLWGTFSLEDNILCITIPKVFPPTICYDYDFSDDGNSLILTDIYGVNKFVLDKASEIIT